MIKKLVILMSLVSSTCLAEWRLFAPNDVHVDFYRNKTVRDPYLKPLDEDLGMGAGFNVDFDMAKYSGFGLYWNNLLHFDGSDKTNSIKAAGWQYELGLVVWHEKGIDKMILFKQHHSQHILEEVRDTHFPVYDRFGFRFNIYP
jgi:hypothetical protein